MRECERSSLFYPKLRPGWTGGALGTPKGAAKLERALRRPVVRRKTVSGLCRPPSLYMWGRGRARNSTTAAARHDRTQLTVSHSLSCPRASHFFIILGMPAPGSAFCCCPGHSQARKFSTAGFLRPVSAPKKTRRKRTRFSPFGRRR